MGLKHWAVDICANNYYEENYYTIQVVCSYVVYLYVYKDLFLGSKIDFEAWFLCSASFKGGHGFMKPHKWQTL